METICKKCADKFSCQSVDTDEWIKTTKCSMFRAFPDSCVTCELYDNMCNAFERLRTQTVCDDYRRYDIEQ